MRRTGQAGAQRDSEDAPSQDDRSFSGADRSIHRANGLVSACSDLRSEDGSSQPDICGSQKGLYAHA